MQVLVQYVTIAAFHSQLVQAAAGSAKSMRSTAEQWTLCCDNITGREPHCYQNLSSQD